MTINYFLKLLKRSGPTSWLGIWSIAFSISFGYVSLSSLDRVTRITPLIRSLYYIGFPYGHVWRTSYSSSSWVFQTMDLHKYNMHCACHSSLIHHTHLAFILVVVSHLHFIWPSFQTQIVFELSSWVWGCYVPGTRGIRRSSWVRKWLKDKLLR